MIELVVFDLDGVLVDACEWHKSALNYALKKVSNYEISAKDHQNIFNGIPTRVKLKKLTDMGHISEQDHKQINDIKQLKTMEIINSL